MAILIKSKNKVPTTLQGIFNRAYRWASREGYEQCVNGGYCTYRNGDNTNACLIGACIPDNLYQADMEDTPASAVLERCGVKFDDSNRASFTNNLRKMQECHDETDNQVDCLAQLREFAEGHNLKVPAS
jgi:hypothetical protein|tara:strand:- start:10005 stop:10391 length:387 start_codon:yes stop_codon:yes gene_type:complete